MYDDKDLKQHGEQSWGCIGSDAVNVAKKLGINIIRLPVRPAYIFNKQPKANIEKMSEKDFLSQFSIWDGCGSEINRARAGCKWPSSTWSNQEVCSETGDKANYVRSNFINNVKLLTEAGIFVIIDFHSDGAHLCDNR